MKYKTLFEIPIYAMSEKEFHKRWEKRKTFLHNLFVSGYTYFDGNVSIGVIHDPNYALKVKGKIYTNDNIYANNINATSTVYCDILNNNTIYSGLISSNSFVLTIFIYITFLYGIFFSSFYDFQLLQARSQLSFLAYLLQLL